MASTEELQKDKEELQKFLEQSERPSVKAYLQTKISSITSQLEQIEKNRAASQQAVKATVIRTSPEYKSQEVVYQKFKSHGWDQKLRWVTVYLNQDNIGSVPLDQIQCTFNEKEVDVRVHNLNGQNYRFRLDLFGYVIPEECSYQVLTDKIKLKLRKNGKIHKSYGETTTWDTLAANFKEEKKTDMKKFVKQGEKLGSLDAPVMDVMGILKEIYKDGDEKTKQEVMKAIHEQKQNEEQGIMY